jgi:hypothetical protein
VKTDGDDHAQKLRRREAIEDNPLSMNDSIDLARRSMKEERQLPGERSHNQST